MADKNAAAEILEETKGTLLATLASVHMKDGASAAKADVEARSDPQYRGHLTLMVEARREANKARVRYDSGKVYAELLRTKAATERAQMDLGR